MRLLLFLFFTTLCVAQVQQVWNPPPVANGSGNGFDIPSGIGVDNAGNVYVGGSVTELGTTDKDWLIIKYDPSGNLLWTKDFPNFGNDLLTAMYVDTAGNVYATGMYNFGSSSGGRQTEIYTIKVASSSTTIWSRRFSLKPGAGEDCGNAIFVDRFRNVFVTGYGETPEGTWDIVTLQYDNTTTGIDSSTYSRKLIFDGNNSSGTDAGTVICKSYNNNIYVGGYSAGAGTSFDFITLCYYGEDTMWTRRFNNTPINLIDRIVGMVVDNANSVIVTGMSKSSAQNDFRTIKYDQLGNVLWSVKYNYFGNDEPSGIAIDEENGIYITGKSNRGDQKDNIFTIKYNGATGDTLWTSSINGSSNLSFDSGTKILYGKDSSIYITAYIDGNDTLHGLKNIALIKLHRITGEKIWMTSFNGEGNSNDAPTAMALGKDGTIYIAGYTYSATQDNDFVALKYVPDPVGVNELFMKQTFALAQNFPNPFNPQTAIGFSLLAVGNVTLKVYDVLGREVQTLLNNESLQAGRHEIQFDGSRLTSGVYFYRLSVEGKFSETKKLLLMK